MSSLDRLSSALLTVLIRGYQGIRPALDQVLHSQFGTVFACSYPAESCSHYAVRVLKERGTIAGLPLIARRVASCWGNFKID